MSETKIDTKRKIVKLNKVSIKKLDSLNNIRSSIGYNKQISRSNITYRLSFWNKPEGLLGISNYLTEVTLSDLLPILKKNGKLRSHDELIVVHAFLLKTDLMRKILKDKLEENTSNKVFYFCALYITHQYLPKDSFLFRKGEIGDRFYIILEGSVNILDYVSIEKSLNGQAYFLLLIKLKSEGHKDLVAKIISANHSVYPINEDDLKNQTIESIFLRYKIRAVIRQSFDKKLLKSQILKLVENYGLEEYLYDLSLLDKVLFGFNFLNRNIENNFIEEEDRKRLLDINNAGINLNLYNYIDFKEEMMVVIYEYKVYLKLSKGEYFGDFALDNSDGLRKATVNTDEETHLGVLPQDVYRNYIFNDKQRFINKEVQFLQPNFFFKNVKFESFKDKYFTLFILQDYSKNKIIFNQNSDFEDIYFVKEGEIEITLKITLLELNDLIMKIGKNISNSFNEFKHFAFEYKDFKTDINKKHHLRIRIFGNLTCLGIEEYFYKLNKRLYTAKANIDNCKLYKIDVDKLNIIVDEEKSLKEQIKRSAKKYLSSLVSRLVELRSSLVEEIHKKENERFKEEKEATIHNKNEEILIKAISNGPQVSNTFYLKQYQDLAMENGQNLTLNLALINNKSLFLTTEKFKTIPESNAKSSRRYQPSSVVSEPKKKKLEEVNNKEIENKCNLSKEEEKEKFIWENQVKKKILNLTRRSNSMINLNDSSGNSATLSNKFGKRVCLPWSYVNQTLLSSREYYGESNYHSLNNLSCETKSNKFNSNANLNLIVKNANNKFINIKDKINHKKIKRIPEILNTLLGTKPMFFRKIKYHDTKEINTDSFIRSKLNNDLIKKSYQKADKEEPEEINNIAKLPSLLNKNTINYVYNNIKENIKRKKKIKTLSLNCRPNIKNTVVDKV